jgi:phospho-N-acetylmuramoyl-pentapeptide-transferase
MLYYLFQLLDERFDVPGAGLFQFLSFRAALSVLLSLIISMVFGGQIIRLLQRKQIGETIRELGLQGENQKKGTPTMGGVIILGSILLPTLLLARLDNIYIQLMVIATIWLGAIGFADDYIKVLIRTKHKVLSNASSTPVSDKPLFLCCFLHAFFYPYSMEQHVF